MNHKIVLSIIMDLVIPGDERCFYSIITRTNHSKSEIPVISVKESRRKEFESKTISRIDGD